MRSLSTTTASPRRHPVLAAALTLALAACLSAQTEPAPTPAAADEEIVKLGQFTVSTARDQGYRASNSISGTRSNTPIRDIPLNIQVFTKEFSEDILANSQIDLERYNAAVVNGNADVHSSNPIQQAYNAFLFRGFVQNWGLRDGIREYDPIDTQGLARTEVVKGGAAPLYGLSYPGGIMNNITKDVDFSGNFTQVRGMLQSYGEYRATIDANYSGAVSGGKFGVRVNAATAKTQDYREHSAGSMRFTQVNLNWHPLPATEVKFLAEDGYREKPVGLGIFTTSGPNGSEIPLQVTHPSIPWTWNWDTGTNVRNADTSLYRGTITHSFNDSFHVTGYVQYSRRVQVDSEGWDCSGGGGSAASWDLGWSSRGGEPTGWLFPNTPAEIIRLSYHHRDWQNRMHAYGATGVYKFDIGDVKNTVTFGGNAWSERFISFKGTQPGGTTNFIDFAVRADISTQVPIGPPSDYFMDMAGAYGRENSSNDYYFVNYQLSALENRLKVNTGINRTNVKLIQLANGYSSVPTITKISKNSPMIGAMFDITPEISVFGVYSTSLFPTTDKNDFFVQMPPVTGKSLEGGVKVELMNGKISGTVSYYQITQTGGSQRDPSAFNLKKQQWDAMTPAQRAVSFPGLTRDQLTSASGQPGDLVPGAETQSKGFEADLVFQPMKPLQIVFSYAHNNNEVTKAVNSAILGQSTLGSIKNQFAVMAKYTFVDGSAKGLSVGAGFQSAGKALQDYSGPGASARYSPSTFWAELFASYKFRSMGYDQRVQLNVKNLTSQAQYIGWKPTSNGTIATERFEVPTKMVLSLTYGIDF